MSDVQALKRKRSPSGSRHGADNVPPASRRRSQSPPRGINADSVLQPPQDEVENANRQSNAQAEFQKLIGSRSGGVYMPPARLRALQQEASKDKASAEYQRLSWDALRKSITGIVNRVNIVNIKQVIPELFEENLIRGRGLFARSIMKAQAASLPFTPVFSALVAILNTKLPQVGELLLTRLISQFRRAYKRNNKTVCHSTTTFIAHLVNQSVAHEIVALQILFLLLERPTDDSIEVAVGFMREVGAFLTENSPKANATVFERFRAVLNEGNISQRVQYMIEVLMQVRKDKFKDNPIIPEGLDLVEEDEQITHQLHLEEELQVQDGLNVFKFDPDYLENEERYKAIKAEIMGEGSDDEAGSDDDDDDDDDDEVAETKEGIEDRTETNLVNLRRIIYLTIMNALNYEEAVHKLLKVQLQEGQEIELVNMILECCSQERSYSKFYGLVGERFCHLNRVWLDCFEEAFGNYYSTIHRYETNRLRNIARFFGHLLATDSISWAVFENVKINEDDTTSSSRIFIKILMTEMMESMGVKALGERFKDEEVKKCCEGMFPMDIPKNTRFAINYFTSIGMGIVTEEMREYLKNAPRLIMEQRRTMLEGSSSSDSSPSSDSSSSSDSDSDSDSDSSTDSRAKHVRYRRTPSPPPVRARDPSRSPPRRSPRRGERPSPPPPPRHRDGDRSRGDQGPRDRDVRRRDSPPPHRRTNGNGRDRSEDRRDRRRERSPLPPPPPPSPPPPASRSRYAGRRRSPSRSRSRTRTRSPPPNRGRNSRRTPSPPRRPARRVSRDDSREREGDRYGRDRNGRRDSRSREDGYGRRRR